MNKPSQEQVERFIQKIKHYLITMMGRVSEEASADEFYRAFCYALREEIMINWAATKKAHALHNDRFLYYFSMEYLPGRFIHNNIINIRMEDLVQPVCTRMGFTYPDIVRREHDPGLGNGGLGRLASCFLDSLATLHLPAMGYGLRYHYGIFEQQIWGGVQTEAPDCWLLQQNPWEFREDEYNTAVKFGGIVVPKVSPHGEKVLGIQDFEEVRTVPYDYPIVGYASDERFSVVTLRLWTTKESPRNFRLQPFNAGRLGQASENTGLTDILYPNDGHETGRRIRLKQEFLLVSASLQDIIRRYQASHDDFSQFADKVRIQINDTHPALVVAELARLLTKQHNLSMAEAWEITRTCTSYTNHTILKEALEEWDRGLFAYLLPRQLRLIEQLNHDFCQTIRTRFPDDEERVRRMSIIEGERIRMAPLAIYGSHKVNGVAALHTKILKESVFSDYYEMDPERFTNVTNGVTQRRWLLAANPQLAAFITERIGDGWVTDFTQIRDIAKYADDPESIQQLAAIKKHNKERLLDILNRTGQHFDLHGHAFMQDTRFDTDSLISVQIKRIHEYKRQLMNALHLIMVYHDLLKNPHSRSVARTAIISGKAAAGYEIAKAVIRLLHCISRRINHDPHLSSRLKVIFIENYCVTKAERIIPAADLSEQISTAGQEASGTGNMKLAINGALTIGTDDGANVEMREEVTDQWWPFKFGCSQKQIRDLEEHGTYNPYDIYTTDEQIRHAVDALRDGSLAETESEQEALNMLFYYLLEGHHGQDPDRYFVLKDLRAYYEMQQQVETLYRNPQQWGRYVLHNIAGMGKFSSDTSIRHYNEKIWGLTPRAPSSELIQKTRLAFSEHDQCRLLV